MMMARRALLVGALVLATFLVAARADTEPHTAEMAKTKEKDEPTVVDNTNGG